MEQYTGTVISLSNELGNIYCEELEAEIEFDRSASKQTKQLKQGDHVQFRLIMVAYVNQRVAVDVELRND